jgi:hypothetical protein
LQKKAGCFECRTVLDASQTQLKQRFRAVAQFSLKGFARKPNRMKSWQIQPHRFP